jgi:hypothetical protein
MTESIRLTCASPEPGIVLAVETPADMFFDSALEAVLTAGGAVQLETWDSMFPLPLDLDELSLDPVVDIDLLTIFTRQPWRYPAPTLRVEGTE